MIRGASIVLILYATSMVFYGSVEMLHDLLHYLSTHHHSTLHHHAHDYHHSAHDHDINFQHGHHHEQVAHSHEHEGAGNEAPSVLNFFLYTEGKATFRFHSDLLQVLSLTSDPKPNVILPLPATPPPERHASFI